MCDEAEWEYREFEDIRCYLVTKCITKYEEMRSSMGIKLTEYREKAQYDS
jgi:hypothetical protein